MSEDFLKRWSRRKLAGDTQEAAGEATLDEAAPVAPVETGASVAEGPPGEMTQEEIDALPTPETMTPETDLTLFLRAGVPAAIRNRALRAMWSIDPAIRDAVGDARDYAWDWNTPGGVPVSGPMPESTDIQKMVRAIFGDRDGDAPEEDEAPAAAAPEPLRRVEPTQLASEPEPKPVEEPLPLAGRSDAGDRLLDEALQNEAVPRATGQLSGPSSPRRHGGALPG